MKRLLSSRMTFVTKVVFPILWSGGFGLATLYLFTHSVDATGKPIPVWMKWQFLIMWVVFSLLLLWLCGPLKRVLRDETSLYISNYLTEVAVPLSHIARVRENRWCHVGGKQPIIVDFQAPTVLGQRIIFIPTGKAPFSWPWKPKPHPVAAELQAIAEQNH